MAAHRSGQLSITFLAFTLLRICKTSPLRPRACLTDALGSLSPGALFTSISTRSIPKATVAPLSTALGIASWRPERLLHGITPSCQGG